MKSYFKYLLILLCIVSGVGAQPTKLENAKATAIALKIKAEEKMKVGLEKAKKAAKHPATWATVAAVVVTGVCVMKCRESLHNFMSEVCTLTTGA